MSLNSKFHQFFNNVDGVKRSLTNCKRIWFGLEFNLSKCLGFLIGFKKERAQFINLTFKVHISLIRELNAKSLVWFELESSQTPGMWQTGRKNILKLKLCVNNILLVEFNINFLFHPKLSICSASWLPTI